MRRFGVSLLPLLVSGLLLASCTHSYERGFKALAAKDYQAAQSFAREGLREDRTNPHSNLLMAETLMAQELYWEALPYATAAFESGELTARAGRALGKIQWERSHPIEAMRAWKSARAVDPTIVSDTDYLRAVEAALSMASSGQDFATVLELRVELQGLDAEHPEATPEHFRATRERVATSLVNDGSLQQAAVIFKELIADFPEHAPYYYELGLLHLRLNHTPEAISTWQIYVDLSGSNPQTRMLEVGQRAERQNRNDVALMFYDQALAYFDDEDVTFRRATLRLRVAGLRLALGEVDAGSRNIQEYLDDMRALRGLPLSPDVYVTAADMAMSSDQAPLALGLLEDALVNAPASWRVAESLASLYARRVQSEDVERVLTTYVDRADSRVDAETNAARWAASRRNYELAQFFFESAASKPSAGQALLWLEVARVYAAVGSNDRLHDALQSFIRARDNNRQALVDAASIYADQRMYNEAENALKLALKQEPASLAAVERLANLYTEWGRPEDTHAVYKAWIRARGNKPEDLSLIGSRFMRRSEWSDALPYFEQAARAGQHDAWLQTADIYRRQARNADMKAALEKYVEVAPNRPRALRDVLIRYRGSALIDETIQVLETLIRLEPQEWSHHELLSDMYFEQRRDRDAFELWFGFMQRAERPLEVLESIARRFQSRGHSRWLLDFYAELLKQEKPEPRLYFLMGEAYYNSARNLRYGQAPLPGATQQAERYYEMYLDAADPGFTTMREFANSMRQREMWRPAAKAYERILDQQPASGASLLHYGTVLLHLGRPTEAEERFVTHYEMQGKTLRDGATIAAQLVEFKRYAAAETYLDRLFDSGEHEFMTVAFAQLAEIYRNSDRLDEMPALVSKYLERAQNPTRARQTIMAVLEDAGLWRETIVHLAAVRQVRDNDFAFPLAINLYRIGESGRAWETFDEYASNSTTPDKAWLAIAEFYAARSEAELTRRAFDRLMSLGTPNAAALVQRGRFLILFGDTDAGIASFEQARAQLDPPLHDSSWQAQIQSLTEAGHFARAIDAARQATASSQDKSTFAPLLASQDLATNVPVEIDQAIKRLRANGISIHELIFALSSHGHHEWVATVIEEELKSGDRVTASQLLFSRASTFTRLGGLDRFLQVAMPVVEEQRDGRLAGALGEFLVREGHMDKGLVQLRVAVDAGQTQYLSLLAHAYAASGQDARAMRLFQEHLASVPEPLIDYEISQLAVRYELMGKADRFVDLLHTLAHDQRWAAAALPMLMSHTIHRSGDVASALALLGKSPWMVTRATESARGTASKLDASADIIARSLEVIGAHGYVEEVNAFVEGLPAPLRAHQRFQKLALHLAAISSSPGQSETLKSLLEGLSDSGDDATEKLRIARLLTIQGHYDLATEIATPLLSSPAMNTSRRAVEVLLSNARASGRHDQVKIIIDSFLAQSPDRQLARTTLANNLTRLGFDDEALEQQLATARAMPTSANINNALFAAHNSGNKAEAARLSQEFWRVTRKPATDVQRFAPRWSSRLEPEIYNHIMSPYREAYSHDIKMRFEQVRLHFRVGEVVEGRELLVGYLEEVAFDPGGVESVLDMLDAEGLYVESARVLGPLIPQDKLSTRSLRHLGIANLNLGFEDEAREYFDAHLAGAADPAAASTDLAAELSEHGFHRLALPLAQDVVTRHPERPEGYLERGIARLGLGQTEGVDADLERALGGGIGRLMAVFRISQAALQGGNPDVARRYAAQILSTPIGDSQHVAYPLRLALAAFDTEEHAMHGVEFLEQTLPRVAAGQGSASWDLAIFVSGLYERAGLDRHSYALYENIISLERLRDPGGSALATYLNNLAYTYSTTNHNIDEGLDMVRRAMASGSDRSPSFIDTLGWLHYRQGNYAQAEAEVRRALRSSTGSSYELHELYSHLALLLSLQGRHTEAVWVQIYTDRIKQ